MEDSELSKPDWSDAYRSIGRMFWLHAALCLTTIVLAATPDRAAIYQKAIDELVQLENHRLAETGYVNIIFDAMTKDDGHRKLEGVLKELSGTEEETQIRNYLVPEGFFSQDERNLHFEIAGAIFNLLRLSNIRGSEILTVHVTKPNYGLIAKWLVEELEIDGAEVVTIPPIPREFIKCDERRGMCEVTVFRELDEIKKTVPLRIEAVELTASVLGLPLDLDFTESIYSDIQSLDRREAIKELSNKRDQFRGDSALSAFGMSFAGEWARYLSPLFAAGSCLVLLIAVLKLGEMRPPAGSARQSFVVPVFDGLGGGIVRWTLLLVLPLITQAVVLLYNQQLYRSFFVILFVLHLMIGFSVINKINEFANAK